MDYKKRFDLESRKKVCQDFLSKYPDRIPVIVLPHKPNSMVITKYKYLIPKDTILGNAVGTIRRNINTIESKHSIIIMCEDGTMPKMTSTMSEIYDKHKDKEDGLLYIIVTLETTFG